MNNGHRDGAILEDGKGFYFAGGIIEVDKKYHKELKKLIEEESKL